MIKGQSRLAQATGAGINNNNNILFRYTPLQRGQPQSG